MDRIDREYKKLCESGEVGSFMSRRTTRAALAGVLGLCLLGYAERVYSYATKPDAGIQTSWLRDVHVLKSHAACSDELEASEAYYEGMARVAGRSGESIKQLQYAEKARAYDAAAQLAAQHSIACVTDNTLTSPLQSENITAPFDVEYLQDNKLCPGRLNDDINRSLEMTTAEFGHQRAAYLLVTKLQLKLAGQYNVECE